MYVCTFVCVCVCMWHVTYARKQNLHWWGHAKVVEVWCLYKYSIYSLSIHIHAKTESLIDEAHGSRRHVQVVEVWCLWQKKIPLIDEAHGNVRYDIYIHIYIYICQKKPYICTHKNTLLDWWGAWQWKICRSRWGRVSLVPPVFFVVFWGLVSFVPPIYIYIYIYEV